MHKSRWVTLLKPSSSTTDRNTHALVPETLKDLILPSPPPACATPRIKPRLIAHAHNSWTLPRMRMPFRGALQPSARPKAQASGAVQ